MTEFHLFVPATSANLGPGFDCMGLALPFGNRFDVRVRAHGPTIYRVEGLSEEIPPDRNLFLVAAERLARKLGKPLPPLEVRVTSEIPLARGLGSSASAVVGGLAVANQVLEGNQSFLDLLALATEIEGHPDNVAPALYGGVCIALTTPSGPVCVPLPVQDPPGLVVAIPEFELSTAKARAALPAVVSLEDAVYNVGRAALLTAVLSMGWHGLLIEALSDRLHQPYREPLVPGMARVTAAARAAGAYGVTLSGAGPTLLAWCPAEYGAAVADRMVSAWGEAGVRAHAFATSIGTHGIW